MADHLHLYTGTGRCIRSVPLRDCGIRVPLRDCGGRLASAPYRVLSTLRDMGYTATDWSDAENAGLARYGEDTFIVRIKSDPMQRDMRGPGARIAIAAIQDTGVEISGRDAWLLPVD